MGRKRTDVKSAEKAVLAALLEFRKTLKARYDDPNYEQGKGHLFNAKTNLYKVCGELEGLMGLNYTPEKAPAPTEEKQAQ